MAKIEKCESRKWGNCEWGNSRTWRKYRKWEIGKSEDVEEIEKWGK